MLVDQGLELLTPAQCRELLGRVSLGRVALTVGALPLVLPVNYAFVAGDIVFFTGEGTKLRHALDHAVVGFEADDVDVVAETGWSVMAVGMCRPADDGARERATALGLHAWAAGDRHTLVAIRPELLSGRRILL